MPAGTRPSYPPCWRQGCVRCPLRQSSWPGQSAQLRRSICTEGGNERRDGVARGGASPVAEYKRRLQRVLENRPSGTRQRLATALGTNRSFISQLANPAYAMPIPLQHLDAIFEVCHFSQVNRRDFL